MSDELRGKGAAVPGTASGIGLECARTLHAAGAQVVLIDRDAVRLDELVAEIGSGAYALKNDLLDPAQLYGLMDSILAIAGGLTIFHANAGSYVESPMVDERLQSAARQV